MHRFQYQVCLHTIYTCGLHLLEGTYLRLKDIDSNRRMIHVVQEKAGKDCYVPRPYHTLMLLRHHGLSRPNP